MRTMTGLPAVEVSGLSECLDRLAATKGLNRPLSTYRLQFHRGFRFADARRLAPYLHALGISHLYSSPILMSRPGSLHGYDITDHNQINPEIGTEEEFQELVRELKAAGMGLVLDTVPNHMGVGHGTNPWWQDVLENGQASRYAQFFDIDWRPLKSELHGKVLLPILGGQYGDELERGNIGLHFQDGVFFCRYGEKNLPIDPQTAPLIVEPLGDLRIRQPESDWQPSGMAELEQILAELRDLPPHTCDDLELVHQRQAAIPRIQDRLRKLAVRSPQVRWVIEEAVERANGRPGDHHSFNTLHRLLDAQAYRLAHWRVSGEEINYRRFFDINELIGLRMENAEVFAATHRLIRRLLAEGSVQGIRIDHPDGLYNPIQYFARLQTLYAASQCCGPEPTLRQAENGIEAEVQILFGQHDWLNQQPPMYVLVEKILEPGEDLPQQWPVDGTVGYDFANLVNGIFIDARNERTFTKLYHRFIGGPVDVDSIVYNAKRLIMRVSLASEVTVLTHMLDEISSTDRHARDFTRHSLFEAIRETIAAFPVYRTYVDERGNISDADRSYIESAIAVAKRRNESMASAVFDFLRDILLMRPGDTFVSAANYRKRLRFALKFQQLTGPVMAKGLEDTACYVYNRLISVNEVGGSPREFGVSVDEFHAGNQQRAHRWPNSMLGTSSHDSKRSEDVRARINVLSEMPRPWAAQLMRWRRANRGRRKALSDGRAVPDANEEYLLYQTLLGAWPLQPPQSGQHRPGLGAPANMPDQAAREEFTRRIQQYMVKAVHEAKVNLSWTNQNPEYVAALEQFIARILQRATPGRPNPFLEYLEQFVPPIAFFGCINSLAQAVLKLTCPGMPDLYQGTELWDFSLVDPDNRRPVDYELRQRLLGDLLASQGGGAAQQTGLAGDPAYLAPLCDDLLENYADGRIKMWTTLRALNSRRHRPELFQVGGYVPLSGHGERAEHLVAFAREHDWRMAITAVPRLPYTLFGGQPRALPERWGDTLLALPANAPAELVNAFTGERLRASNGALLCREIFAHFPVALLLGD